MRALFASFFTSDKSLLEYVIQPRRHRLTDRAGVGQRWRHYTLPNPQHLILYAMQYVPYSTPPHACIWPTLLQRSVPTSLLYLCLVSIVSGHGNKGVIEWCIFFYIAVGAIIILLRHCQF